MASHVPTLTRADYTDPAVFELERQRLFLGSWYLALRADSLKLGNRRVLDIAGESVLVTRDLDGTLHAFANVCRHRGARLCDADSDSGQGSVMCPYHAWTYALDGRLIATPHLTDDDVDKAALSLWRIAVAEWEGFVFLCLADTPPPFDAWFDEYGADVLALQRFGLGALTTGFRTVTEVQANWKIIVENYMECLHCTRVHPELVEIIPTYRSGAVVDHSRDDWGVEVRGNSFTRDGSAKVPVLPGMSEVDEHSYFGGTVFPNGFVDITGTSVIVSFLQPKAADHTTVVTEYLFAPSTVAADGFDPSDIVEFSELVAGQDYRVCEMVQRGVGSKHFTAGVLSPKDELVIAWKDRYRGALGR